MRRWASARSCSQLLHSRLAYPAGYLRCLSTHSAPETFRVPCHSNGSITLDIYRQAKTSPHELPSSRVAIYLPPGPLQYSQEYNAYAAQRLQTLLPFPVVRLNYRMSREHPYPTPIHDVLTGYDWIKEHILPKRAISRSGRPGNTGSIAVYGEFIGGGLAAMLALTECRIGQPGITAAAISNPVVDWVELEEGDETSESSLSELVKLRGQLFRKPDHYFDPFASPMLFLRSAGREAPPPPSTPLDDFELLSLIDREEREGRWAAASRTSPAQEDLTTNDNHPRKTGKRYPSASLGLRLPTFHISTSSGSPLLGQGQEFARRLQQCHVRQASAADFGRKVLSEEEIDALDDEERLEYEQRDVNARKKVQLAVTSDAGSWSSAGNESLVEAAGWLKSIP